MMTEKAIKARRAYKRKWNHDNREKVREYQERYWERKAGEAEAERERSGSETDQA